MNKLKVYYQWKVFAKYGERAIREMREATCLDCAFCEMQKAIPQWCRYGLLPVTLQGHTCPYFAARTSAGQAQQSEQVPESDVA